MRQMTIDDATIAWSDTGAGEPTLLIHAGGFGAWFAPVAPHLPGRVIRLLRAGYTDGPAPTTPMTVARHAAHAAALLDALDTGPTTVVAHSLSSLVALELAATRPDLVRRLVLGEPPLLDPLLDPVDVADMQVEIGGAIGAAMAATARGERAAAYDAFMGAVCGPRHRAVVAAVLGADGLARAERESEFFFANEVPAMDSWTPVDPADITVPTLLVVGAESRRATHRLVARLAGLLPRPEVATIPGADHLLPLTHPRAVADLVTSGSVVAAG
jgi:pimeloyl-ACP methyl ester carboxylesterase